MHLEQVWRYPVKSMAGERISQATLRSLGVPGDREYVVVDAAGRIRDARSHPRLLLWRPGLDPQGRLQIDGIGPEDPRLARLLARDAGPGARLVRVEDVSRFDVMPLLVTTDGAVAALGVDRRRLRPNLVVGGVVGLAEREWEGQFLAIGDAVIGLAQLRSRCIVTTWDPDTAAHDPEVLRRIGREFAGRFALDAWVARPGLVRVGDRVTLLESFADAAPSPRGRYAR